MARVSRSRKRPQVYTPSVGEDSNRPAVRNWYNRPQPTGLAFKETVMPKRLTRRRFLQTTAAAGAAGFFSGLLPAADKKPSANERLHVGVIGVTNQGAYNLENVHRAGAEIVALCDI